MRMGARRREGGDGWSTFAAVLPSNISFLACDWRFALYDHRVHSSHNIGNCSAKSTSYAGEAVRELLQACLRSGEVDVITESGVDGVDDVVFSAVQSAVCNVEGVCNVPWGPSGQPTYGARQKQQRLNVTAAADLCA